MLDLDRPDDVHVAEGDSPSAQQRRHELGNINEGLNKDDAEDPFVYCCPQSHLERARDGW